MRGNLITNKIIDLELEAMILKLEINMRNRDALLEKMKMLINSVADIFEEDLGISI